jgi:hypothetical protein
VLRDRPHLILAAAAFANVLLEVGRHERPTQAYLFLTLECCILLCALAYLRRPERIRLWPLLVTAASFQAAWIAVRLGLDQQPLRTDSSIVYRLEGNRLLQGHYPRSEYPPGAVVLFAFEALVGGGRTLVSNALLMIPFQALTVASVWALRTRSSALLAAFVALWPANAFFWAFRFDLVPTALLAAGLLLAWRRRWGWAGVALGIGAAVKWTPALAVLVVAAWLLARRQVRDATCNVAAAVIAFVLVNVPFLAWAPGAVVAAYRRQAGRGITGESVYYLPLKILGLVHTPAHIYYQAGEPRWADHLAVALQIGLLAVIVALAARRRSGFAGGLALAACAPAAFLLANRIFSPQFFVPILAGLAFSVALVGPHERRPRLAAVALIGGASLANAWVFPFALPAYGTTRPLAMAVSFALAFAVLAWSMILAARDAQSEARGLRSKRSSDQPRNP